MIVSIALFTPIRKLFDYKVEATINNPPVVGTRAIVPFGNKIVVGFIVAINSYSKICDHKLKSIIEVIDLEPIFSAQLYKTLYWAANYYQAPIGAILDCALPKYLKINKIPKPVTKQKINKVIPKIKIDNNRPLLNYEQQEIINKILQDHNKFQVTLIEGVTGSGKTEIYLQLAQAILNQNKQILILVPEIGLTPQTWQRFKERFTEENIVILHSNLSARERYLNWLDAKNGKAKIILGTRSATFVPLANPGLFIIDEEHDVSFKQQDSLYYMARDCLIMRAKFTDCPIVLGSATPSLETLQNAYLKKYNYYQLPTRAISQLPEIQLIDIRHKKLNSGLSNAAIEEISNHLSAKNQVLLFINRRGFAPTLKCFSCQLIIKCSHCDANMNLHIYTNKLHCHHCQRTISIPSICPQCQTTKLIPIGQGTERIEALLQQLFPQANIARIDRDSISKKQQFTKILNDILTQKINLLIGTQMIGKGHHFPKLSLVVIINLDQSLFSSDFRSTERLGQLIIQVAGRAGRENPGKVLLQTSYPTHPLIQAIAEHNYQKFSSILLQERKIAELPPFSHQVLWRTDSKTLATGLNFLSKIKNIALNFLAQRNNPCKIFGPIPAIMEKRKKKFHARLLLQHTNRQQLQELTSHILEYITTSKVPSSISWSVDVDPKEIF